MARRGTFTRTLTRRLGATALVAIFAVLWSGTVRALPTQGPRVVSQFPVAAARAVDIDTLISVTWDQPMAAGTSFAVAGPTGLVSGWFSYELGNRAVVFHPAELLLPGAEYHVSVTGQVGASGLMQLAPASWAFQTAEPTSVSIARFSAGPPVATSWWWTTWPWLMVILSATSLLGLLWIWRQRRPDDA